MIRAVQKGTQLDGYRHLAVLLVILVGTATLLTAQHGMNTGRRQPRSGEGIIAEAGISERHRTISVGGRLQPKNRIVHLTPTGGFVQTIAVGEGQYVEKGQVLFSVARKDDVANIYKPSLVTARISGLVSEVLIQVEDDIQKGEPAIIIVGEEGYELEATVSDKDAFKVPLGQTISGRTAGGSAISGTLVNRSQEPDYATGLFILTFQFPNDQRTFVGEFVMIELPVDRERGLFVRRELVIRRYGKYFLWLVNQADELEAREVVLGAAYGELVLIEEGLKPGERYLTRLTGREKEGEKADSGRS